MGLINKPFKENDTISFKSGYKVKVDKELAGKLNEIVGISAKDVAFCFIAAVAFILTVFGLFSFIEIVKGG